jgi:hypothetical protein
VMRKARQHEAKEYARVQDQKEGKDGGVMLKDKKLALYVYLLKKSCNIMNTAVNSSAAKPPGAGGAAADSGGGLHRQLSGRNAINPDAAKYWELLDLMRPYKTFALKCVAARILFPERFVHGRPPLLTHPFHSPSARFIAATEQNPPRMPCLCVRACVRANTRWPGRSIDPFATCATWLLISSHTPF